MRIVTFPILIEDVPLEEASKVLQIRVNECLAGGKALEPYERIDAFELHPMRLSYGLGGPEYTDSGFILVVRIAEIAPK